MFDARIDTLDATTRKVSIMREGEPLAYGQVLRLWRDDADFRAFFIAMLVETPYTAYRWETPALSTASVRRAFECVLMASPRLAKTGDPAVFAAHLDASEDVDIVTFENLGGDALLVVPSPHGPLHAYGHLAAFSRLAPVRQNHALWQTVGRAMEQRLGTRPIWLNTAGAAVPWLHVRLDDRPKYYGFEPYREA
jgi:hypothetical protein